MALNQYEVSGPPKHWPRTRVELKLDRRPGVGGVIFDRTVTNPKHPYVGTKTLVLPVAQARDLVREGWSVKPDPGPEPLPVPVKEQGLKAIPLTIEEARAQEEAEAKLAAATSKAAAKEAKKAEPKTEPKDEG